MTALVEDRLRVVCAGRPPGLAAAVVRAERVEFVGVGVTDLTRGLPASAQMVCPWFSMTKLVTATVTAVLVERGLMDLDAPLRPLVPAFDRLHPKTEAARITARHLLTHSAGLANPIPVRWIHAPQDPPVDQETLLERLLSAHPRLRFSPGQRSSYTNLGALSLGVAMAHLTGVSYPDLVRREVLAPLMMPATGFSYTEQMRVRAATGYHPRLSPMRLLLPGWAVGQPAGRWVSLTPFLLDGQAYGGLIGSLHDAARFLQMHLRDGELDGTRVLGPDRTRQMRDIVSVGRRVDLGLGWFRPANRRTADPPFVEHLGGGAGYFNLIRIYPTRDLGIVVMGNATRYDLDAVATTLLNDTTATAD